MLVCLFVSIEQACVMRRCIHMITADRSQGHRLENTKSSSKKRKKRAGATAKKKRTTSKKPVHNSGRWSKEELILLNKAAEKWTNQWKKISAHVGTRNDIQCKGKLYYLGLKENESDDADEEDSEEEESEEEESEESEEEESEEEESEEEESEEESEDQSSDEEEQQKKKKRRKTNQQGGLTCTKCGKQFTATQGLGMHKRTCGAKKK